MRISPRQVQSKLAIAVILYLLLSIPDPRTVVATTQESTLETSLLNDWWPMLENDLNQLKSIPHATLLLQTDLAIAELKVRLALIKLEPAFPDDRLLRDTQETVFKLSPRVALLPEKLEDYKQVVLEWKQIVKNMSRYWNLKSADDRRALYYYLTGSRIAVNQAILQSGEMAAELEHTGFRGRQYKERSNLNGINLESGDFIIWNSFGDYPILGISKDLPGSYNAVSIVYIPDNGEPSMIFTDPNKGVFVLALEDFKNKPVSSGIVLRLRKDLPALVANPNLPHEAAEKAMAIAEQDILYDFAMDDSNEEQLYPTELLASVFRERNLSLGIRLSEISSLQHREWLSKFGVTNYSFVGPSELEFDPQTLLVGYWADADRLMEEQIQFAATYTALEQMDENTLQDNLSSLPQSRILKVYSSILNIFGANGPIPAGMSAQTALAFKDFEDTFKTIREMLASRVKSFEKENHFKPTYPQLLQLARIGLK